MINTAKKLAKRLLNFTIKLVLVALPAVISSALTYHFARLENRREVQSLNATIASLSKRMRTNNEILHEMHGQVAVLKHLAAVRIGMGMPPFQPEKGDWDIKVDDLADLLPSDSVVLTSQTDGKAPAASQ